jgi:hypothetical protein
MSKDFGLMRLLAACTVVKQPPFKYEQEGLLLRASTHMPLVYKKAYVLRSNGSRRDVVLGLAIPARTLIIVGDEFSHNGKLRASQAIPRSAVYPRNFYDNIDTEGLTIVSGYSDGFEYKMNKLVKPESRFCRDYESCESGIHFFMDDNLAARW